MDEGVHEFYRGISTYADVDGRIEIFQLIERGLGPGGFSDILLPAIEITTEILDCHYVLIEDGDLFWPSENEIFGDLNP